ncbi:Alpha-(1,3)-fucosyltransferase C [Halotydeus destructor]|nr:Alpha-(1,3)-fucosyltransferase C [Halotydeus destructor]
MVLFHLSQLDLRDLPRFKPTNQRWTMFTMETPIYYKDIFRYREFLFFGYAVDYLATYRRDSDIWTPFGHIIPRAKPKTFKMKVRNKTRNVAWFASRCVTFSKREEIAKQLQDHIDVDIYGQCGAHLCPKTNEKNCYKMMERKYKFYLSFENSVCEDYATEKLFNILKYDVIPVVYGGAELS